MTTLVKTVLAGLAVVFLTVAVTVTLHIKADRDAEAQREAGRDLFNQVFVHATSAPVGF